MFDQSGKTDQVNTPPSTQPKDVHYRCMTDVISKPISWLWPNVIAQGKVNLIAGHPGLGKSQVAVFLAATTSIASQWPTSSHTSPIGSTIILSAEDDASDTIKPRLEAAGGDPSKVYILDGVATENNGHRFFSMEEDLKKLASMIEKIGDVSLVIIDPISAYLGKTDSHKDADVRRILSPLTKLAEEYNVAIVCVGHLNKGGSGSSAITRASGSMAFIAAARTGWFVVKDDTTPERRLLLPAKNNLGKDTHGFAFKVCARTLPSGIDTSYVKWENATVSGNLDRLLEQPSQSSSAMEEAVEFIAETLATGPRAAKQIEKEAEDAGISKATLMRAKQRMSIKSSKESAGWVWQLHTSQEDQDEHLTQHEPLEHLASS